MSNLVLYRKYRPKAFSEIIGQEHIVKTLTNAISSDTVSHAYLFTGPRGSGKTTLARLLAKAVNCENPANFEPCNKCLSCQEINQGRAIDLIEMDAASHRGIDEIRDLKEGIKFGPTKSRYKVFIIDEAHQLTKEAANALLKTLEEPPSHAIFVLATTEIHKMIPTIISRCQRFDFRKLTLPQIVKKLDWVAKKESVNIENTALEFIALNSQGSLRDAEGLLEQAMTFTEPNKPIKAEDIKNFLGIVDIGLISKFIDLISEKKTEQAIYFLQEIIEQGNDLLEFSKALINYLRQALILKISGAEKETEIEQIITGLTKEEFQKLLSQTKNFQEKELQQIIEFFLSAENKIKYSSIPQLPLELAIIDSVTTIKNSGVV